MNWVLRLITPSYRNDSAIAQTAERNITLSQRKSAVVTIEPTIRRAVVRSGVFVLPGPSNKSALLALKVFAAGETVFHILYG